MAFSACKGKKDRFKHPSLPLRKRFSFYRICIFKPVKSNSVWKKCTRKCNIFCHQKVPSWPSLRPFCTSVLLCHLRTCSPCPETCWTGRPSNSSSAVLEFFIPVCPKSGPTAAGREKPLKNRPLFPKSTKNAIGSTAKEVAGSQGKISEKVLRWRKIE